MIVYKATNIHRSFLWDVYGIPSTVNNWCFDFLKASFVVEGFSPEELEERADKAQTGWQTARHRGGVGGDGRRIVVDGLCMGKTFGKLLGTSGKIRKILLRKP